MGSLRNKLPRQVWRIGVGVVGGIVLIAGAIMIPYPGPGWVVVLIGLAILAQEFTWARQVLSYTHTKYDGWNIWVGRQSWLIRSTLFIATAALVIATIWLLNGYGVINSWFHLGWSWLNSPFIH